MQIPAYLRRSRHGIYFFRICIPATLQERWRTGRELKLSLRTRDQRLALARARDLGIAAHKHFGYALGNMSVKPFDPKDMTTWPTDASELRKFEKTIETLTTAEGFVERVKYKVDPTSPADIAAARADEILHQKRQRFTRQPNSLEAQAFFQAEEAELRRSIMADAEVAAARRQAELADLQGRLRSAGETAIQASPAPSTASADVPGHTQVNNEGGDASSGDVRRGHSGDSETGASRERRDASAQSQFDKYKLSALWIRYCALKTKELGIRPEDLERTDLDAKTASKVKTIKTYMMKFGTFIDWSGDRHIQDVNHEDVVEYKEHLMHAIKVRAGRKAGQMGLDLPTVDNYVGVLNGLYKWAQKGGLYPRQMLLPTFEQRETTKAMKRDRARAGVANRAFKTHELIKAFRPVTYMDQNRSAHHYWPALIAMFTGIGLGEISQLALDDIRLERGLWAIDINDEDYKRVKSAAARRIIPMHPDLIDLGLPEFVEDVRKLKLGSQLFPMLLPEVGDGGIGNAPGKKWDLYLKVAGLTDDALTFHSLRKTANTLLKKEKVPFEVRCQIVGHENDHVNELYATHYSVKELAEMIFPVFKYEGLDLDALRRPRGSFDESVVKNYERAVDDRKWRIEEREA